jgi:hypothetical protein
VILFKLLHPYNSWSTKSPSIFGSTQKKHETRDEQNDKKDEVVSPALGNTQL